MTPSATRQFITLVGDPRLSKGARWVEPLLGYSESAFVMGQDDYLTIELRFMGAHQAHCPFEPGTVHAALWAAGKLMERKHERAVVEAYECAKRRQS